MKLCIVLLLLCLVSALPAGNIVSGSNTCPSSGNKRVGAQAKFVFGVVIAGSANGGKVNIGGSTVDTSTGAPLNAGDSFSFPPQGNAAAYDLSNAYFACATNTDTITYVYVQ